MFLSVILITLTCSSGCFVFLHYAETIFREAGTTLSPQLSSIIVATIQMSGSYMATFWVEKAGRKLLIICSAFGAAMCLTIMGIHSLAKSRGCDVEEYNWIPLLCLSGVVFIAAHGSASLPYVVVCEILGQKVSFTSLSLFLPLLYLLYSLSISLILSPSLFSCLFSLFISLSPCLYHPLYPYYPLFLSVFLSKY